MITDRSKLYDKLMDDLDAVQSGVLTEAPQTDLLDTLFLYFRKAKNKLHLFTINRIRVNALE